MDTLDRQLPDVASGLARSVHSGATLLAAIDEVRSTLCPPARSGLDRIVERVDHGWMLDDALVEWNESAGSASLGLLVAACRLGHAEGGDLKTALDGVATALLDRVEVADETRALTSQARMSAGVLALLPVFGAAGFSLLDSRVAAMLFTTRPGALCLSVGVCLNLLGALSLSRIVRVVVR